MSARKRVSQSIEHEVLVESKRRCALCFGLHYDDRVKKGQIAHLDRNSGNPAKENLAYLCLEHHEQYDCISRQAKGYSPAEVKTYRAGLHEFIAGSKGLPAMPRSEQRVPPGAKDVVGAYEKKVEVYRAAMALIDRIVEEARVDLKWIHEFTGGIEEAPFMFDDSLCDELWGIRRKAINLYVMQKKIEAKNQADRWELLEEEAELLSYFGECHNQLLGSFRNAIRL